MSTSEDLLNTKLWAVLWPEIDKPDYISTNMSSKGQSHRKSGQNYVEFVGVFFGHLGCH